jgi:hypothetical protein
MDGQEDLDGKGGQGVVELALGVGVVGDEHLFRPGAPSPRLPWPKLWQFADRWAPSLGII